MEGIILLPSASVIPPIQEKAKYQTNQYTLNNIYDEARLKNFKKPRNRRQLEFPKTELLQI